MKKWLISAIFTLAVLNTGILAQQEITADEPDIATLIRQLGDDNWEIRENATRKLARMGPAALSALRKAMLDPDPELSTRARMLYKGIVSPTPEKLEERRKEIQEAFRAADYATMIRLAQRLTLAENITASDWLWLGHGCQLSGRWKDAVATYQHAVGLMDAELKAGPKPAPVPAPDRRERIEFEKGKGGPQVA